MNRKIPATMASQHPDHARKPYWHDTEFIGVHNETEECFLNFSELGIDEYKWDWEGKLVDESFMERLLGEHFQYFKDNPLGLEKFLTFRLPNPKVETEFRIGRALISILSAAAMARQVGLHYPPVFEVILPMAEKAEDLIDIQEAFMELTNLKHPLYKFETGSIQNIRIIPLFEEINIIMNSHLEVEKYIDYLQEKLKLKPTYFRPYFARSDPALNAGMIPTVLAIKIALSHYAEYEAKSGIKMYPIIGCAALPFRGGLTPLNVKEFVNEYKGIRTTLIQSGFRYDYEKKDVIKGVKQLNELLPNQKTQIISKVDEDSLRTLLPIFEDCYKSTIEGIADLVNQVAAAFPRRRERVQHVGLFGYSRGIGKVKLPRAIGFTGSLYSIGVPPELIGTGRGIRKAIEFKKMHLVEKYYLNLKSDLTRSGKYLNKENLAKLVLNDNKWREVQEDIEEIEKYLGYELGPKTNDEKNHYQLTERIYRLIEIGEKPTDLIKESGVVRRSLG